MKLTVTTQGEVSVVRVAGELNADTVPRFAEAVEQSFAGGRRDFVIDLSEITTADSAGLEALTALQRRCEEALGLVRFCGADDDLAKILEITRLDKQLVVHENLQEALSAVAQP